MPTAQTPASAARPASSPRMVALSAITLDDRTWPREQLDAERVKLFTELYTHDADVVPPIEIFAYTFKGQEKPSYILVDGRHRYAAREKMHATNIPAIIRDDLRNLSDAYIAACQFSATSSKPLTTREKRAAVRTILNARADLSDRAIARIVGCSHNTVSAQRNPLKRLASQVGDAFAGAGAGATRSAPRSREERALTLFTSKNAAPPDVATLTALFRADRAARDAAARWTNAIAEAYRASAPPSAPSASPR